MNCRTCGHPNPLGARTCSRCHRPMEVGIRRGFHCPRCGQPNPAATVECRGCGYKLEPVEALPEGRRTEVCPDCQTRNPPIPPDAVAFCIGCGRRLYGAGQVVGSVVRATPEPPPEELSLARIDELLAAWPARLRAIDAALAALGDSRADPAVARAARGRDALAATIERARRLRSGIHWFWPSEEKQQEIAALLTSRSIAVPAADVLSEARRSAAGAATVRVTLDELAGQVEAALGQRMSGTDRRIG